MSGEGENPASKPTPVQDVQGDGRWMSLHHRFVADSKDKEPEVVFIGDSLVQLMHQCEVRVHQFSPSSFRHVLLLVLQAQDKGVQKCPW
uniref:Pafah1b3 protein n=1 Tax=Rattus norvegicus TaxID=10116 RepID=A0JN11_RAT|nr:Pafah1b3 protein [Rattus norvegicus]